MFRHRSRHRGATRALAAAAWMLAAGPAHALAPDPAEQVIPTRLEGVVQDLGAERLGEAAPAMDEAGTESAALQRFYRSRDFEPVWLEQGRVTARARAVIAALEHASEHGLAPRDYGLPAIQARADARSAESLTELEALLSIAFVRYARHLSEGRLDEPLHPADHRYARAQDPAALLRRAAQASDPAGVLQAQAPRHQVYTRLRRALTRYHRIAERGGWPALPPGPTLRRGDRHATVPILRERLHATEDLDGATSGSERFGAALEAAVRRFQQRHGLTVDGIVGPNTRAAMNVPAEDRVRQLVLNLERARWLPHELGRRHVLVNIAGYWTRLVEGSDTVLRMKAIVGKAYQQTPAFSDEIRYIELNPYWNVPRSIAANEIIPAVIEDPGYLERNHMQVLSGWDEDASVMDPASIDWQAMAQGRFPYRIRQKPGPQNALGQVKFMFPNEFSVYMHDTPARALFQREVRTFSHGCIRLSRPFELAQHLLGDQGWSAERIQQVLARGERTVVPLRRHVPVHVTYLTAWMHEDGRVQFRPDVYERNQRLARALFEREPPTRYASY